MKVIGISELLMHETNSQPFDLVPGKKEKPEELNHLIPHIVLQKVIFKCSYCGYNVSFNINPTDFSETFGLI